MVSGRGLGQTGGTLDELEAIPGFRTQLGVDEFARIVRDVGCCITPRVRAGRSRSGANRPQPVRSYWIAYLL